MSSKWPDLDGAPPALRTLLRRIDHPRTGPRRRRELCAQALRRVRRDERPRLWAVLQIELGSDWMEDPDADPADKIERAIRAYRRALAAEITAQARGAALANLGFCFTFRLRGSPTTNLETAIDSDRKALEALDPEEDRELRGTVLHRLAANLLERSQGDRNENLETARQLFEEALRFRTIDSEPLDWAATRNGLAALDAQRVQGDRVENQERAIAGFQEILQVFTCEDFPERWAETWANLGNLYAQRLSGEAADNREKAIAAYRQALEVFTVEDHPERWARTQLNLGNAFHERVLGDREDNLKEAIACYERALRIYSRKETPVEWATAQDNLGTAWSDRSRGDPGENRERALAAHRAALSVWRRGSWEWVRTQNNLGTLYGDPPGGAPADRRRAARCFQAAVSASPVETYPDRHRLAQRNLGHLWFAARRWKAAQTAYAAALQASEILFRRGGSPESREAELRENLEIPIRSAYALARLGRLREAVDILEQGRARTIGEALEKSSAAERTAPAEAFDAGSLADRLGFPLVYLLLTRHGSLGLIVPPTSPVRSLWLDGFTDRLAEEIDEREGGFLWSVSLGDREGTKRALEAAWPLWRERLMLPLAQRLRRLGFDRAVLIPCGRLALWPLPATVAGEIRLSLAPSARLLASALDQTEARRSFPPCLVAVVQPGSGNRYLPSADSEAERMAAPFAHTRILRGPEATREVLVRELSGATHLHFACHGSFDADRPLDSALELAGEPLTLGDVLNGGLEPHERAPRRALRLRFGTHRHERPPG